MIVVSTHAPAGGLERRASCTGIGNAGPVSTTRSSRRAGATARLHAGQARHEVSTHAPAGGLERPPLRSAGVLILMFQHTLQPEGWSDSSAAAKPSPNLWFQHTLQPEGWSDANFGSRRRTGWSFTPHAPAGGLERPLRVPGTAWLNVFQHTLQPEGWSDHQRAVEGRQRGGFNTRSSRRAGATQTPSAAGHGHDVSTHAPAGGLERLRPLPMSIVLETFQHTLQPEGWSDLPGYTMEKLEKKFQHTLQPEGWSDPLWPDAG